MGDGGIYLPANAFDRIKDFLLPKYVASQIVNGRHCLGSVDGESHCYLDWMSHIVIRFGSGAILTDRAIVDARGLPSLPVKGRDVPRCKQEAIEARMYSELYKTRVVSDYSWNHETRSKCDNNNCWHCSRGGIRNDNPPLIYAVMHKDLSFITSSTSSLQLSNLHNYDTEERRFAVAFHVGPNVFQGDCIIDQCTIPGVVNVQPVEALFACCFEQAITYGTAILECELCLDNAMAIARASKKDVHALVIVGVVVQAGPDMDATRMFESAAGYSTLSYADIETHIEHMKGRSKTTIFVGGASVAIAATIKVDCEKAIEREHEQQYRSAIRCLNDAGIYYDQDHGYYYLA